MVTMLLDSPVGQRIKSLREDHRWTQEELSAFADVPRSWLGLVETGEIGSPGAGRLHKLAKALDTSTDFLLTGEHSSDIDLDDPELSILFQKAQQTLSDRDKRALKKQIRIALEMAAEEHGGSRPEG